MACSICFLSVGVAHILGFSVSSGAATAVVGSRSLVRDGCMVSSKEMRAEFESVFAFFSPILSSVSLGIASLGFSSTFFGDDASHFPKRRSASRYYYSVSVATIHFLSG